jgi:hypothetical protein
MELWSLTRIEPTTILNLDTSLVSQTISRIITISLQNSKRKKDTAFIMQLIMKFFVNFGDIQLNANLYFLGNLRKPDHNFYFKHVSNIIKVTKATMISIKILTELIYLLLCLKKYIQGEAQYFCQKMSAILYRRYRDKNKFLLKK